MVILITANQRLSPTPATSSVPACVSQGVVVDKEFVALLEEIQKDRFFIVNYEVSLPVAKISREEMREKIGLPSAYNVDPLRMLYLLKVNVKLSFYQPSQEVISAESKSHSYSTNHLRKLYLLKVSLTLILPTISGSYIC